LRVDGDVDSWRCERCAGGRRSLQEASAIHEALDELRMTSG
jgi:hypothetical protein